MPPSRLCRQLVEISAKPHRYVQLFCSAVQLAELSQQQDGQAGYPSKSQERHNQLLQHKESKPAICSTTCKLVKPTSAAGRAPACVPRVYNCMLTATALLLLLYLQRPAATNLLGKLCLLVHAQQALRCGCEHRCLCWFCQDSTG